MTNNIILMTDSYKVTHWMQYPPDTQTIYSYLESRGGKHQETVFFGLQYFIKKYLMKPITEHDIVYASNVLRRHFGNEGVFNELGWRYILREHGGKLPVSICAVPEGSIHPIGTPLITIENTDPKCFWLTNYLETLLVQTWYPITVATESHAIKRLILSFLERTGAPEGIDFKLHDFGFRGVSSPESAGLGGLAHLVNFKGTDTLQALEFASQFYYESKAGFSIPAAEHSTITSWGKDHEIDAFRNMIHQFGDESFPAFAVVSDSYNIYNAVEKIWCQDLRRLVSVIGNTLVIRPDSGDPLAILPGLLRSLADTFGSTANEKGFSVLNPRVRLIQGDGVDYSAIHDILILLTTLGWSTDNIAFGMGGALLQKLDRDTQKFAFKCSSGTFGGVERDVWKDPISDRGKASKRGRFTGRLREVYRNGRLLQDTDLASVRTMLALETLP